MLLRHGRIVAEGWWSPYSPDRPHVLHSLSKSFTSTAVGMAIDEGRLTVDDFVLSYFRRMHRNDPESTCAPCACDTCSACPPGTTRTPPVTCTAERMATGRAHSWRVRWCMKPGTHFLYNTGATYMLSAIVQKLTGQTLLEYLSPRLFTPLGIEGATWESWPARRKHRRLRAEHQDGRHREVCPVVPEAWGMGGPAARLTGLGRRGRREAGEQRR